MMDLSQFHEHFKLYTRDCATEEQKLTILDNCVDLFKKDYTVQIIENDFCQTYPKKIIIPQERDDLNTAKSLKTLFEASKYARVRSRSPVPVIHFNGKNICRSATLAQKAECIAKAATNGFSLQGALSWFSGERNSSADDVLESSRNEDISLIKALHIRYICDLMVEDKKKKFGIYVTSSEKTDRLARYAGFCISAIPYPGTEFFALWKEHNYSLTEVDWTLFGTDTTAVVIDPDGPRPISSLNWKSWDIIELTKNYMHLILAYIASPGDGGVLVHCISGWDRTPLYVSLIRMSLWADGAIHQNLTATEMLYLTVNYDWFLFHHYLKDRCSRGEDIFYFCFYFLSFITGNEFSIDTIIKNAEHQVQIASHKISILPSDDTEDSQECGSFGSCGRSWEMTSEYMNQYGKSLNSNPCIFLDDNSLHQNSSECSLTENIEPSDDALFSFDDGEEEFHVLSSSCDGLPECDPSKEIERTPRERKLLEIRQIMMEAYSSFVGDTW